MNIFFTLYKPQFRGEWNFKSYMGRNGDL